MNNKNYYSTHYPENSVLLRRKNKLIIVPKKGELSIRILATILKNLEQLGYTLSKDIIDILKTYPVEEAQNFYEWTVQNLKVLVGANVSYKPMYPNFPKQVMEASDAELFINAILHYFGDWVGVRIMPEYEVEERPRLLEKTTLKVIGLGTPADLFEIFINLVGAKSSISESDKEDVSWFVNRYPQMLPNILPEEIPHKENLSYVSGVILHATKNFSLLTKYYKTATDVLRLATALSGGDVSLATNSTFTMFRRPDRKFLLGLLDGCKYAVEDMMRYRTKWIRLGEILHPGDYKTKFPRAYEAFKLIRNERKPVKTFNSEVEEALKYNRVSKAVNLLLKRPGEYARRLDKLVRTGTYTKKVVNSFKNISQDISTPVLLQVMEHFKNRNNPKELRVFFPKGTLAKAKAIDYNLDNINQDACDSIVNTCRGTLVKRFKELPSLGKVYLESDLKNFLVPFSQRSATKALKTIVRGSSLDLPGGNTVRFFIWWKNMGKSTNDYCYDGKRVDIDLSAVMYDGDWNYKEHVSYTQLRGHSYGNSRYSAVHSGDITSAPRGACEFIDIDINSIKRYGGRYVIMNVLSFTNQKFCDMPECYAGWMMRKNPGSGEIFEPKTVQNKIDLSADTTICMPLILDLKERKVIWLDLALKKTPGFRNNIETNYGNITVIGKAMTQLVKPNLYDLFQMHVEARGEQVYNMKDADTVFVTNDYDVPRVKEIENDGEEAKEIEVVTPFDLDVIMAKYL